jgi:hypothetical protein
LLHHGRNAWPVRCLRSEMEARGKSLPRAL